MTPRLQCQDNIINPGLKKFSDRWESELHVIMLNVKWEGRVDWGLCLRPDWVNLYFLKQVSWGFIKRDGGHHRECDEARD